MAANEVYRVEIPIIVDDQTEAPLRQAGERVNRLQKSAERTNREVQRMAARDYKLRLSVLDRAMPTINRVSRGLRSITGRVWNVTLRVKDSVFGAVRRLTSMLMSPLGLLGAGAGVYGLNKATVGAAMTWETQAVSMEHWLQGNKALAQEVTKWLEQFAATTPFEMEDLFPAMTRAIGITEGDIKMSERMLKLAADMAGLTPGKTVQDAMEALADAQMGEFERMKEFQMKMTQEQYKAIGGWAGFLTEAETRFAGGAEKLSQTASGRISTITDNIKTLFRQAGIGILDALKPRLDAITKWFDDNKDTMERWKTNLVAFGREGAEAILNRFERAFRYIQTNYLDNTEFQQLDFAGKITFVMDDLTDEFESWWSGPGGQNIRELGETIGASLIGTMGNAAVAAVLNNQLLALLLGAYVGMHTPGPIQLKIIVGISIAMSPYVKKIIDWITEHSPLNPEPKIQQQAEVYEWYEQRRSKVGPDEPIFGGDMTIGPAHATGGIFSRPHLGLVAEAGPEAVIPLSARMKNRALGLWEETGRWLGIRQYAEGGFAGPMPAAVPVATPSLAGVSSAGGSAIINAGPVNVTFNVSATDGKDVLQVIRAHRKSIADEVASDIAEGLGIVSKNMPRW